jgi:ThiF family
MSELGCELRDQIAERWPTAAAFYLERDDRTERLVGPLAGYTTRPVEIYVDPEAAGSLAVQRIALVAANLTVRWARRVRIIVPRDARLHTVLRRRGWTTLAKRIEWEMRMADPFFDATPRGRDDDEPLRLFVGPWRGATSAIEAADYQVHAAHWTALGRRGSDRNEEANDVDATAAAAGLAGALGAADVFKRAVGHERGQWLRTFGWDTWSSQLTLGAGAWGSVAFRAVPECLNFGRTLLAGVGAVGSAFVYLADMMQLEGELTLFDRDAVDATNLNRSPLFTVLDALTGARKTRVSEDYLADRSVAVERVDGVWRIHSEELTKHPFDVWISLTNEDGAWAEQPFQLPPVVLHGTTTSGWGFGVGRHIPRVEDCTLCRMPRPEATVRMPCATGEIVPNAAEGPRASLPFLSTASAALVLASYLQLEYGPEAVALPNDVGADLSAGLPTVIAVRRRSTVGCRGCGNCRALRTDSWLTRGGRGRFARLSAGSTAP